MQKILIIEDEPAIVLALKDELNQDYEILAATEGRHGLEIAEKEQPELILLDLLLPDIDGFDLCQRIKERGIDAAIIMLTARDEVVDKVKGLELGADDYITKPFSLEELRARINAVLRRKILAPVEKFEDAILKIDFKKYKAFKKQRPIKLSPLEFKLLRFLISKKGQLISRDELLQQVWGFTALHATRTVDVHVLSLRKKIGKKYISTVHREGYRFEG